jgi:hypothetical protein
LNNQLVILDNNVADFYEVETKRINEAVINNPEKFPEGYIVEVSPKDWLLMKSKFSTSLKGGKTKAPKAFPEKGLYMLATILKSPRATQATLAIIEAFAKIRELGKNINQLSAITNEEQKQPIMQRSGELIAEIFENDLSLTGTETTFELNFAVLKFKHTVKKGKK